MHPQLQTTTLPASLTQQLDAFFESQSQRCSGRAIDSNLQSQTITNFKWAKDLATVHYKSRIIRANDLKSSQVLHAQALAHEYIGYGNHDFFATCVDGRNMPTVMFSKPPHVGGVLRAPAGTVNGFLPGQAKDTVYIDHSTFVVQRTAQLLREKTGGTIFYGLDSHISCAARGLIHETEGGRQSDGGTRSDILNKIMTARGILQLRNELLSKGKAVAEVIPTFFSFDPNTGGVWFGLETCVNRPEVVEQGFTINILKKLAAEGYIINSLDILLNPEISKQLQTVLKPESADFRSDYAKALENNWNAITALYDHGNGKLFQTLLAKMHSIYEHAGWLIGETDAIDNRSISDRTMRQKTKFLLKNLVTRYSIAGLQEQWPFNSHQEEMVVITDGGYAPFPATDAFAVFSRDLNALVTNTKLTIDIIRSSRKQEKLTDPFPQYEFDHKAFIAAPVLVSNKAIVKGLSDADWHAVEELDLHSAFSRLNWDDTEVLNWRKTQVTDLIFSVVNNKHVSMEMSGVLRFIEAVFELFQRMQVFLKDKHFRQMMITGNIVVLNTIVDENRMPRMILPLVV